MDPIDVHGMGHVKVNRKAKENKTTVARIKICRLGSVEICWVRLKGRLGSQFQQEKINDSSRAGP